MSNMISNISFGKKLIALLVLPVISIFIFSGKEIRRDLMQMSEMRDVQNLADLAISAGNLVHNTQAERGATSLFLSSKGREFSHQMQKQREQTDLANVEFRKDAARIGSEIPRLVPMLNDSRAKLDALVASRQKTDALSHTTPEMVKIYTGLVRNLIDLTGSEAKQTSDPRTGSILRGYVTLNNIKEYTGRQRALLTSALAAGKMTVGEYQTLRDFVQARSTLTSVFGTLAPLEVVAIFQKTKESAAQKEFSRMEAAALAAGAGNAMGLEAKVWYRGATEQINSLRTAEGDVQQVLRASALGVRATAQRNLWTDAIVVIAALFSAGLFGTVIARNITRRLKGTLIEIDGMVSGNLTIRARDEGGDELGIFAQGLNRLADKVHVVLKSVNEASKAIKTSSAHLTETSSILSSGTEQTSVQSVAIANSTVEMNHKLQSLSSAIEEMSISISEISAHGAKASRMANDANEAVAQSAKAVDELGHSATDIGAVTEMISYIADQTKMLALNASIEAAGAGEAGKGFSVVASEVKELARQTAESTETIRAKISAIQERTANAVSSMGQIEEFVSSLRDINSSIASTVEEQSMVVKEIASHISTAVMAAGEVSSNIAGISAAAAEGAREAMNSSGEAKSMLVLSGQLNEAVSGFTV